MIPTAPKEQNHCTAGKTQVAPQIKGSSPRARENDKRLGFTKAPEAYRMGPPSYKLVYNSI